MQSNASATTAAGDVIATHLAGGKEAQAFVQVGADGHIKGTKDTFNAIYRLPDATTTGSALSIAFTANQMRQIADIWHLASSTKRVTIKRVEVFLSATAATILTMELIRLTSTTAAAGGTAIVPVPMVTDHAAVEASCMALPTTAASFIADRPLFSQDLNLGANTALTTGFDIYPFVMFPPTGQPADDDLYEPALRAGVAEGYAVAMRSSAAVTIKASIRIIFTEE